MLEQGPEKQKLQRLELDPSESNGFFDFKGFSVYYDFEVGTQEDTNQERPAEYAMTPNTGGGESLSVWIWEGVPEKFKEILLYHEITEADLVLNQGVLRKDAHKAAVNSHMQYANEFLNKEDYDEFVAWQGTMKFED